MRALVIGTRGSALAMRQAGTVQDRLGQRWPGRVFSLKAITAQADRDPELPLTEMSGEGVFVKELESALLDRSIDLAVHSLKDVPLDQPAGLRLAAVLAREEPRDAFVSRTGEPLEQMPKGARVGTSSLRRRSQLLRHRPDLDVRDIRGNVDTRLRKLDAGQYDAIIVAACGLIRLGLQQRITQRLDPSIMMPEPGQGALAVEARAEDADGLEAAGALDDAPSRACVEAERALLRALGGGCRVPIAAFATVTGNILHLEGAVVSADGRRQVRSHLDGPATDAVAVGECLGQQLAAQGGLELLSTSQTL